MFTKHLKAILKEMCKRVGAKYTKIDFSSNDWFSNYEWTEEEQDDFKKWLVNYLYENKEARNELMAFPRKRKKEIEKFADEFLFQYGWKFK